jgi:hypothetical protein
VSKEIEIKRLAVLKCTVWGNLVVYRKFQRVFVGNTDCLRKTRYADIIPADIAGVEANSGSKQLAMASIIKRNIKFLKYEIGFSKISNVKI